MSSTSVFFGDNFIAKFQIISLILSLWGTKVTWCRGAFTLSKENRQKCETVKWVRSADSVWAGIPFIQETAVLLKIMTFGWKYIPSFQNDPGFHLFPLSKSHSNPLHSQKYPIWTINNILILLYRSSRWESQNNSILFLLPKRQALLWRPYLSHPNNLHNSLLIHDVLKLS